MLSRLMGTPAAVGCLLTVLSTACDATRPSMPGTPTAPPAPHAGKLADRTVHYRHDLAFAEDPTILRNPHNFIVSPTSANALVRSIALGAQPPDRRFLRVRRHGGHSARTWTLLQGAFRGAPPGGLNYVR